MKNTILSQSNLNLLERVIAKNGRIATFEQLYEAMGESVTRNAARKRVSDICKAGWLVRVKRGVYLVITDITTLGFADISELVLAHVLNQNSYISFESALQYYGMFDQMLSRIGSVTTDLTKEFKVHNTTYTFSKIKKALYFGFRETTVNGKKVNIAEKEKALLDMLYFRSSSYGVTLVLEKLKEYKNEIDFEKIKQYSTKYSLSIVWKTGFLLDQIGIDTSDLQIYEQIRKNSYNRLTAESQQFNAKWRLYYDSRLIG
jgi:predicted transcriptional regulator of viral defense system